MQPHDLPALVRSSGGRPASAFSRGLKGIGTATPPSRTVQFGLRSSAASARRHPITEQASRLVKFIGIAALLLPFIASAESSIQTDAVNQKLSATAHVSFKIVIPLTLYMRLGGDNSSSAGPRTVTIMSDGRTAMLNATVGTRDEDSSNAGPQASLSGVTYVRMPPSSGRSAASWEDARRSVIFTAAARGVISRDEQCALDDPRAVRVRTGADGRVTAGTARILCTASMP